MLPRVRSRGYSPPVSARAASWLLAKQRFLKRLGETMAQRDWRTPRWRAAKRRPRLGMGKHPRMANLGPAKTCRHPTRWTRRRHQSAMRAKPSPSARTEGPGSGAPKASLPGPSALEQAGAGRQTTPPRPVTSRPELRPASVTTRGRASPALPLLDQDNTQAQVALASSSLTRRLSQCHTRSQARPPGARGRPNHRHTDRLRLLQQSSSHRAKHHVGPHRGPTRSTHHLTQDLRLPRRSVARQDVGPLAHLRRHRVSVATRRAAKTPPPGAPDTT